MTATAAPPGPRAAAAPRRRLRPDRADLPLAVAVAVELLVLALLPRVVTVDGPAHLLGGWVLAHPHDAFLQRWYEIDLTPVPNLTASLLLAVLLRLAGPDTAEKLLVAGYVAGFPLALRYALRGVDRRAGWLAVVAVPLTPGYLFTYGFYDLVLALVLALVAVGLVLRRRSGWTPAATAALALLLVLTWFTHLLPLLVAGLTVAVLALARVRAEGLGRLALRRHLLPVVVAGLPVLALTVHFVLSPAAARGAPVRAGWFDLLTMLLLLRGPVVSYSNLEIGPAAVVAVALGWLALRARRGGPAGPEREGLLVACALVTVAFFASPYRYGLEYGFLNDRIALFPPLLLLLWAAGPPPGPRARRAVVGSVLGAAVAVALVRVPTEVRYQREVAELMSVAPAVPPHSRLLKVQLWRDPPGGGTVRNPFRDPLRHELGRLAVQTDSVDVGHYEAVLDYFPARFRPGDDLRHAVDPTGLGLLQVPPQIDLGAARDSVDVVVVLGRRSAGPAALSAAGPLLADLARDYRRVAVSRRTGLAEVWVRR